MKWVVIVLFCLVPSTVYAVICMVMLGQYAYAPALWLAVMAMEFLFFFSLGAFCAMCAGNKLGMTAVYLLLNFLAPLLYLFADSLLVPLLHGISLNLEDMYLLSPVLHLSNSFFADVYDYSIFHPEIGMWIYAGVVAVLGLGFAALALVLYRKRKLEAAGDFIALKPVGPVFLVFFTLFVGTVFKLVADGDEILEIAFLAVGLILSFFLGKMLLQRTVRVFRGKDWLHFGIFTLAFLSVILLTWLDPIGLTRFVPKAKNVQSVTISNGNTQQWSHNPKSVTLTDEDQIQDVVDIHKTFTASRIEEGSGTFTITYKLKGGTTVTRVYDIAEGTEEAEAMRTYFSSWQYIFRTDNWTSVLQNARCVYVDYSTQQLLVGPQWVISDHYQFSDGYTEKIVTDTTDNQELYDLLWAIKDDCEAGRLAQDPYPVNYDLTIAIQMRNDDTFYLYIPRGYKFEDMAVLQLVDQLYSRKFA